MIGLTKLISEFRNTFGAPYYVVHRAHFHAALYQRALDLGVTVKLASRVDRYDPHSPKIFFGNGDEATADLIVAADGLSTLVTIFEQLEFSHYGMNRSQVNRSKTDRWFGRGPY